MRNSLNAWPLFITATQLSMLWVCDSSTKIRCFLSCWLGMKFHMIRGPIASPSSYWCTNRNFLFLLLVVSKSCDCQLLGKESRPTESLLLGIFWSMGRIKLKTRWSFLLLFLSLRWRYWNNKNPGGTKTDAKTFRASIRISFSFTSFPLLSLEPVPFFLLNFVDPFLHFSQRCSRIILVSTTPVPTILSILSEPGASLARPLIHAFFGRQHSIFWFSTSKKDLSELTIRLLFSFGSSLFCY